MGSTGHPPPEPLIIRPASGKSVDLPCPKPNPISLATPTNGNLLGKVSRF
jgi:hypothetical protein